MKFKIITTGILVSVILIQSAAYAEDIITPSDYTDITENTDNALNRTKTPIEGMEGYYVMGESYPMANDCYIADNNGKPMSLKYKSISTKPDLGGVIKVSVNAGMSDSRYGYLNKNFDEIVPCEYGNMTVKEENGFIYIEAPNLFDSDIDYYDLDGNKIENLYELTKNLKTAEETNAGCDSWAKNDIASAIDNNIVPENLQSDYKAKITREEFCELAMETYFQKKGGGLVWQGEYENPQSPFNDVCNINVSRAHMLGVVSGTGNGRFSPNDYITRQEAAVMLCNLAKVLDLDHTVEKADRFIDESYFADWAKNSIYRICGIKCESGTPIMAGTGNGKFSPWFNYQRQQAIVTMERLYETKADTTADYKQSFKSDIDTIADSYSIGNIDDSLFNKENYETYIAKWQSMAKEGAESSYISELDDAFRTTTVYLAVCDVLYVEEGADREAIEKISDTIIQNFRSILSMNENEILNFLHGSAELSVFEAEYTEAYYRVIGSGAIDKYNF